MADRETSSGAGRGRAWQGGSRTRSSSANRPARSRGTRQARLRRDLAAKRASGAARMLGLTTTRRAAVLAIVVCALAFTIAVPLRTYLEQQSELAKQRQRHAALEAKVARLKERKQELTDPAVIEAEARSRLGMVMPGETPYMVQLPGDRKRAQQRQDDQDQQGPESWYSHLWTVINSPAGVEQDQEQPP